MATERRMEREDDLDDHAYQVREVYAQFGLAMYVAQVLEAGVLNALTLWEALQLWGARQGMPFEDLSDELWEANFALTLGGLLKKFRKAIAGDAALTAVLGDALRKRNQLAHSYFWNHAEDMMSFEGREAILAELIMVREQLADADRQVTPVLHHLMAANGWTQNAVDHELKAHMARMRARAEGRDRDVAAGRAL